MWSIVAALAFSGKYENALAHLESETEKGALDTLDQEKRVRLAARLSRLMYLPSATVGLAPARMLARLVQLEPGKLEYVVPYIRYLAALHQVSDALNEMERIYSLHPHDPRVLDLVDWVSQFSTSQHASAMQQWQQRAREHGRRISSQTSGKAKERQVPANKKVGLTATATAASSKPAVANKRIKKGKSAAFEETSDIVNDGGWRDSEE